MRPKHIIPSIVLIIGISPADLRANALDEIGQTRLKQLAASELPTAPGSGLTQVEALDSGNYGPDSSLATFSVKSFSFSSGTTGVSNHATTVATQFYGSPDSLVPGSCSIRCHNASLWIAGGFLRYGSTAEPLAETSAVQNHSWIATELTDTQATDIGRRLDHAINRDGFSAVVGVNNGNSTTLPQLLAQSYHTISVGLANGAHSAGFTTLDTTGRIKPDLVAPDNYTSFATPLVSSAAALIQTGLSGSPYSLTAADRPRVTKTILLASARKDNVASWSNTTQRPLDLRYGAGNLNIHHAWQTLCAGRATASSSIQHGSPGWAAETIPANGTRTWFFTIPPGAAASPFCAALTWHRTISDNSPGSNWGNLSSSLANLNLRLVHASGFATGATIAESASTVDNVELIHQPLLSAGSYALVVENLSATATASALAWHSLPTVTLSTTDSIAREIDSHSATFTISRTGDTSLPLFIPLSFSGSAVAENDFAPLPANITLPAGENAVSLTVTPVSDQLAQGSRILIVSAGPDFSFVGESGQSAAITIEDKPFDAWRFAHFTREELENPAISSALADPDGDALSNLAEYALALSPKTASTDPSIVDRSTGSLRLSVLKNPLATDLIWNSELSADLEEWEPAEILTNTTTTFEARSLSADSEHPARFIRLRLTRP